MFKDVWNRRPRASKHYLPDQCPSWTQASWEFFSFMAKSSKALIAKTKSHKCSQAYHLIFCKSQLLAINQTLHIWHFRWGCKDTTSSLHSCKNVAFPCLHDSKKAYAHSQDHDVCAYVYPALPE